MIKDAVYLQFFTILTLFFCPTFEPLRKIVVVIVFSGCFLSCRTSTENRNENHADVQADSIRISTFQVNDGYGYEIYLHNTKVINQPTIPVIEGNKNFPTRELALDAALLVSSKIRKGIIPPAISHEEIEILLKKHNL